MLLPRRRFKGGTPTIKSAPKPQKGYLPLNIKMNEPFAIRQLAFATDAFGAGVTPSRKAEVAGQGCRVKTVCSLAPLSA